MTVLGAMKCGDFGLLAVDSGRTAGTYRTTTDKKIWRCQKPSLAWAIAGNESVGWAFNEWLSIRTPKGWSDWTAARFEIGPELHERNGNYIRDVRVARADPSISWAPHRTASALVVGWLGGVFDMLEVSADGGTDLWSGRDGYCFAGVGREGARYVVAGIKKTTGQALAMTAEALYAVMETVAKHTQDCELPIRMVKVARDGVTDLDSPSGAANSK